MALEAATRVPIHMEGDSLLECEAEPAREQGAGASEQNDVHGGMKGKLLSSMSRLTEFARIIKFTSK